MQHVLDNPAYHALLTGNSNLANGTDDVKYFDKEVSPFFGLKENTAENFRHLYDLIQHNDPVGLVCPVITEIPAQWKVLNSLKGLQMIYEGKPLPEVGSATLIPLTNEHIPQMLELTKLTNPGPFFSRTIEFGHYRGIFESDQLVAMAGQRMNPEPYAEISAVCTHPDHTGKGYAKQLLHYHINRIKTAGGIPILHVREDNERAINVYQNIGFTKRSDIYFTIMVKAQ